MMRRLYKTPPGDLDEDDTEMVRSLKQLGVDLIRATRRYISDPGAITTPLDEDA